MCFSELVSNIYSILNQDKPIKKKSYTQIKYEIFFSFHKYKINS